MPKPEDSEAKWWMRVDIHVVQTIYERQQFICNKQFFNLSCKLCNMKKRFKRQDKLKEAEKIRLRRYSFLNIIDRDREAEGVKVWMAPISAWNRIHRLYFKDYNPVEFFDTPPSKERRREPWSYGHDLSVFYYPDQEPALMYYVEPPHLDDKSTPLGTDEQREIWASEVLPLLPENYYDPIEFKDLELKLMEERIERLVSHEEYIAYTETPEYEAEMERNREEERQKKIKDEKEKVESKKRREESLKKWREKIRSGEAAQEIIEDRKKSYGGYAEWDFLKDLFYDEKDWDELEKILSAQLKEEYRKMKQKILSGEIPLSEIDEYDLISCFSCSFKEAQQIKKGLEKEREEKKK